MYELERFISYPLSIYATSAQLGLPTSEHLTNSVPSASCASVGFKQVGYQAPTDRAQTRVTFPEVLGIPRI